MVLQTAGYAGTAAIGGVALRRPGNENDAEKVLTGAPMTRGYKPSIPSAMFQATRGQAYMPSMLADVEVMLLHPCVVAPYLYYRAAIASVKFKIKASSSAVGEFVLAELQKFWSRCLTAVQDAYDYGWIAGELSYQYDKGLLGLYSLETFHPLDCWALTVEENYVGVSVQNIPGAAGRQSLWGPDKYPAKGFWYAHNRRWDRYYGRSQLYGAWRPWRRLGFRDGAEEVIDAGVYRFAYRGPIMRYPVRSFARADGTIDYDGAQSKAREFVENAKAGASVALPNTRDEKGNYEWEIDWPDHTINVQSLVEYAKYLEAQISLGIGVPMELLQAADTGSGWSGRKVPMLGFYQGQKRNANAKVTAWKWQIGDPLVAWNFGPDAWFEVGTELVLPGALSEEGQQPPGGGMPPPPPGGGGNPLAGLMGGGGGEQGGEMSTLGDGNVNSLYVHAMQSYRRTAQTQRKAIELGYTLAEESEREQPKYQAARTRSGGLKAVNPNNPEDVKYGAEAQRVLQGRRKKKQKSLEKARRRGAAQQETQRRAAEQPQAGGKPSGVEAEAQARQLREQAMERARAGKPQQAKELLRRAEELSPRKSHEEERLERDIDQELKERDQKGGTTPEKKVEKKAGILGWALEKIGKVYQTTKTVKNNLKEMKEIRDEDRANKAWGKFEENYRTMHPVVRSLAKGVIHLGELAYDYLPGSLMKRMRRETSEKNRLAKEKAQDKKGLGKEADAKDREGKADGIIEVIETVIESVDSVINGVLGEIPLAGGMLSWLNETVGSGPILTGAYVLASAAVNPWGTMQAAWNVLARSTKTDKERGEKQKERWSKAEEFAKRSDRDPQVVLRKQKMKDQLERAKKTALGFDLGSDDQEEGKLYPGLRHRIREVFEKAKDPDWAEALFFACLDRYKKDPAKAIAKVEELLEEHPNQPPTGKDFHPETWFGLPPIQGDGQGEADKTDDESSDPDMELCGLVVDSVWVLAMPQKTTDAELHDLQRRLKTASPETRGKVNQGVRKILG